MAPACLRAHVLTHYETKLRGRSASRMLQESPHHTLDILSSSYVPGVRDVESGCSRQPHLGALLASGDTTLRHGTADGVRFLLRALRCELIKQVGGRIR